MANKTLNWIGGGIALLLYFCSVWFFAIEDHMTAIYLVLAASYIRSLCD